MTDQTRQSFKLGLGHGFDVEKDSTTLSGFKPARYHDKTGVPLLADLRLHGFAAALELNICETLLIAARDEERYPDENINQAWAIYQMLVFDLGADSSRLRWIKSGKGTDKNVLAMSDVAKEMGVSEVAVITNRYHIKRSRISFEKSSLSPEYFAAEDLWLEAGKSREEAQARGRFIDARFAEDLAKREAAEKEGLKAYQAGTYVTSYEKGVRS